MNLARGSTLSAGDPWTNLSGSAPRFVASLYYSFTNLGGISACFAARLVHAGALTALQRLSIKAAEAARNEPDGMAGVLSEMHEGGKFSDLRRQFNAALATDRSLSAAYDKAASALSQFGQDRSIVQDIIARRPDASALTQRFEKMDAEIGEAAASAPSRNDGRSMLNDLSDKAAELVKRAVEAVRSAFSRSPSAGAASSPSPSP